MWDYFSHQDQNKYRLDIYMLSFLIQQNLDSTNNESHTHLTRDMYSKGDT